MILRHRIYTDYIIKRVGDKWYCVTNGYKNRNTNVTLVAPGEKVNENLDMSNYTPIFSEYYKQLHENCH